MKKCVCEFEIFEEDGSWIALPLGIPGATEGRSREEAIDMAVDWLRLHIEHAEIRGLEPPSPKMGLPLENGGERLAVCLPVDRNLIDVVKASEAARMLGISRSRVSKLVADRKLEGWREGRNTYVTRESVIARLSEPKRTGGRPKKKRSLKVAASF